MTPTGSSVGEIIVRATKSQMIRSDAPFIKIMLINDGDPIPIKAVSYAERQVRQSQLFPTRQLPHLLA